MGLSEIFVIGWIITLIGSAWFLYREIKDIQVIKKQLVEKEIENVKKDVESSSVSDLIDSENRRISTKGSKDNGD